MWTSQRHVLFCCQLALVPPPAQSADETYDISTRARICLPSGLNLYVYTGGAKGFVYCDYQQVVVVLWLFGIELEFAFKFGGGSSAWAQVSKVQVHDVLDSQRQAGCRFK